MPGGVGGEGPGSPVLPYPDRTTPSIVPPADSSPGIAPPGTAASGVTPLAGT